jgi:hypothetical protein
MTPSRPSSLLFIAAVVAAGLAGLAAAAQPAASPFAKLRVGNEEVDYGSAMSPIGEYSDALAKPESFPQDQQLVVRGVVVTPQGEPVQGVVVRLFPLEEEGPGLILGMVDGGFGIANPAATTDDAGRFAVTTGPLWRFTDQVVLGLIHPRSPDRPFDVGVLPFTNADGTLELTLDGERREFDLGDVALAVSEPGKP